MTQLFIKNMVCHRCILAVQSVLDQCGLQAVRVELGEITLAEPPDPAQKQTLQTALQAIGFELIDDKKSRLIEQIKARIITLVHHQHSALQYNLSEILRRDLHYDYHYLSALFSEVEGSTIEKYFIAQKIEKVKELLVYDELSLSEIADRLHYSSVAYLSNQFKKVTGLTPSHFKQIGAGKRKPIDQVKSGK